MAAKIFLHPLSPKVMDGDILSFDFLKGGSRDAVGLKTILSNDCMTG
jgi:hypothetical protein